MTEMKQCKKCGENKPLIDYYEYVPTGRTKPYRYARCKACVCGKTKDTYVPQRVFDSPEDRKEAKRQTRIRYYRKLKQEVFDAYGNVCACCGESTYEFLTLDHVNNDGAAHRKQLKASGRGADNGAVWRNIRDRGFPAEYQLMCYNCNCAKQFAGGCPHQKGKVDG